MFFFIFWPNRYRTWVLLKYLRPDMTIHMYIWIFFAISGRGGIARDRYDWKKKIFMCTNASCVREYRYVLPGAEFTRGDSINNEQTFSTPPKCWWLAMNYRFLFPNHICKQSYEYVRFISIFLSRSRHKKSPPKK